MPLRIPVYTQQTTIGMAGAPRASAVPQIDGIGSVLSELGDGLAQYGKQIYTAQREADLADRLGRATAELTDAEISFEQDQDFRTAPDRFKTSADAIAQKYLQDVQDPATRAAFSKQFGQLSLAKSLNVRRDAFKKERDYNVASLDTSMDVYAQSAATAGNPAERAVIDNQARLAIASAQSGGWISAEDAGKRERGYLGKIDEATVIRDLSTDPSLVVAKLGIDPAYAPNIDPARRERFIDQALRRGETDRKAREAEAERVRKQRGDDAAKTIWGMQADGKLTREYLDSQRHLLDPGEYKSMLEGLKKPDEVRRDDPTAYATLERAMDTNPGEARRLAFQYHRSGLIKNETLNRITDQARNIERQEGPRSPYERERSFITNAIRPSDMVPDPAAQARYALAMREFDDFARAGNRSEPELRQKADDIIKRRSMVDMVDLANRTGIAARPTPEQTIAAIDEQIVKLSEDFKANKITKADRDKRIQLLTKQRQAAEKSNGR